MWMVTTYLKPQRLHGRPRSQGARADTTHMTTQNRHIPAKIGPTTPRDAIRPSEVQISTDCWHASNEGDEQDKAAWLKAKRAEEQTASEAWSEQYRMPPLEGTERAVPWGVRCRHQILTNAYTALVTEGTTSEAEWAEIEENARTVTRAGWWIDQRSSEPEDLTELLRAATGADRPTENPFF